MEKSYTQIFSENLPSCEDIVFEPLLKRYKKLQLIESVIFFAIALIIGIVAFILFKEILPWMFYTFLGLWTLCFSYIITSIFKGFPLKGFAIREEDIHYRKGWLKHSIITVPICRIQHLKVAQSALGKLFKLATLEIYTAGDSLGDISIKGISLEKAQQIKSFISQKITTNDQQ